MGPFRKRHWGLGLASSMSCSTARTMPGLDSRAVEACKEGADISSCTPCGPELFCGPSESSSMTMSLIRRAGIDGCAMRIGLLV